MKKVVLILVLIFFINSVNAGLYDEIKNIERNPSNYIIVIGPDAPSTDNLAASELALEFQKEGKIIPTKLANEVEFGGQNMILIGTPCDNEFVEKVSDFPACDEWNYDDKVGMIKSATMNGYKYILIADSEDSRKPTNIVNTYTEKRDEIGDTEEIFTIGTSKSDLEIKEEVPEAFVQVAEETTQLKKCGDNCLYNEICYAPDIRVGGFYCDSLSKEMVRQKEIGENCNSNFECKTSICTNNYCVDIKERGLMEKLISWFKNLF